MTPSAIPFQLRHTMLRVADLTRSIKFYTELLGMRLIRSNEYPDGKFTLAFVGYGEEASTALLELTYNWEQRAYDHGSAFGHIALAVSDLNATCANLIAHHVQLLRAPGPMAFGNGRSSEENIAFIADPDGYRIELIEIKQSG